MHGYYLLLSVCVLEQMFTIFQYFGFRICQVLFMETQVNTGLFRLVGFKNVEFFYLIGRRVLENID
jgi:hypothetical protein